MGGYRANVTSFISMDTVRRILLRLFYSLYMHFLSIYVSFNLFFSLNKYVQVLNEVQYELAVSYSGRVILDI